MTCNEGVEIVCFGIRSKEMNPRLSLPKGICCELVAWRKGEREGERGRGREGGGITWNRNLEFI